MRESNPYTFPIWYTVVIDAGSLYSLFPPGDAHAALR